MMDVISQLVADALRQSRVVQKCLDSRIIPLLEPRHRSFATDISRRIAGREIVNEAFLRDLDAFIGRLDQEVSEGTSLVWRGHEHDPNCGYSVPVRNDRARALGSVLNQVVELETAIEAAIDAAEACVISTDLFDD